MDAYQVVSLIDLPPFDGDIEVEKLFNEVTGERFSERLSNGDMLSIDFARLSELAGFLAQHAGQKNKHLDDWRSEMRVIILSAVVESFNETVPRIRRADIEKISFFEDLVQLTGQATYGVVDDDEDVVEFEFRDIPRDADGSYSAAMIRDALTSEDDRQQPDKRWIVTYRNTENEPRIIGRVFDSRDDADQHMETTDFDPEVDTWKAHEVEVPRASNDDFT